MQASWSPLHIQGFQPEPDAVGMDSGAGRVPTSENLSGEDNLSPCQIVGTRRRYGKNRSLVLVNPSSCPSSGEGALLVYSTAFDPKFSNLVLLVLPPQRPAFRYGTGRRLKNFIRCGRRVVQVGWASSMAIYSPLDPYGPVLRPETLRFPHPGFCQMR